MKKLVIIMLVTFVLISCDDHVCKFEDKNFKPHTLVHHHKSKVYPRVHNNAKYCFHDWDCHYYGSKSNPRNYLIFEK